METYQEDQTVQEQSVEEGNGPGHLVGENRTTLRGRDSKSSKAAEVVPLGVCVCVCLSPTRPRVALSQGLRLR